MILKTVKNLKKTLSNKTSKKTQQKAEPTTVIADNLAEGNTIVVSGVAEKITAIEKHCGYVWVTTETGDYTFEPQQSVTVSA